MRLAVFLLGLVTATAHAAAKGEGRPAGGGRWFWKMVQKRSWFRELRRWHVVDRTISRRGDRHDEVIVDGETGQVVREVHEPL